MQQNSNSRAQYVRVATTRNQFFLFLLIFVSLAIGVLSTKQAQADSVPVAPMAGKWHVYHFGDNRIPSAYDISQHAALMQDLDKATRKITGGLWGLESYSYDPDRWPRILSTWRNVATGSLIKFAPVMLSCPDYYYDNGNGTCYPYAGGQPFTPTPCGDGFNYNEATGQCIPNGTPIAGGNAAAPTFCPSGNPINQATGNKFQMENDFTGSGPFPLTFTRTYNSSSRLLGMETSNFGAYWRHNYHRWISISQSATLTSATAFRQDGKAFAFTLINGAWIANSDVSDTLTKLVDAEGTHAGWQLKTRQDEIETYNAQGRLVSIANLNGLTQTLSYDTDGKLSSVTDHFGRSLTFTYDGKYIMTVTDPSGGVYGYKYDSNNNLVSVTYPDNKMRTYLYEEPILFKHALTGIIDEKGDRFATWQYDIEGRAISSEHAVGVEKVTITYHADGSSSVTDALNTTRTHQFQTILGVLKNTAIAGPACTSCGAQSTSSTYDANGYLASSTDFNGNVTIYVHNDRGLETSRTEASGTPNARTITTEWHSDFRLPTKIIEPVSSGLGQALRETTLTYDAQGNVIQKTVSSGSLSRTWNYSYNSLGLLIQVDGPRTDAADITRYEYDTSGNLISIANAANQVTKITSYDVIGRPLSITDPNGAVTNLRYDQRGRLISRTAVSETTAYEYDDAGQLIKVTLPTGAQLVYTYDAAHRLVGVADSFGNKIIYTLDAMGNRIKENAFDPSGSLAQMRSRVFDALNRLAKDIGAQNQATSFQYDKNNNLTGVIDPLTHTTKNAYDALNRLVQVTDPNNGLTRYGYDANDQLISVTDARGLVTNYQYDGLGNQTQLSSPDTGITTNVFDAAGNAIAVTDARSMTTAHNYDALNRVVETRYSDGSTLSYQYDVGPNALGHLTQLTDPTGTTQWQYDVHGKVTKKQQSSGIALAVSYAYDAAGQLISMTYPSGVVIKYSYIQGQLDLMTLNDQPLVNELRYQPFGPVKQWRWSNNTLATRTFDGDGRIISHPLGTTTRTVSYDVASRITGLADGANAQSYGYDLLDRLTSFSGNNGAQSFQYDAVGNRTSMTAGTATTSYAYAASSNRLTQVTATAIQSYTYDAIGSTLNDGVHQYAYDARGRLTNVDSDRMTYLINGLGQRVAKLKKEVIELGGDATGDQILDNQDIVTIRKMIKGDIPKNSAADCNKDGLVNQFDISCIAKKFADKNTQVIAASTTITPTYFAYDEDGKLIGEYDANGQAIQETIYIDDMPVIVLKQGNVYYIHADHLNTPRAITDTSNKTIWRWDSDPFGTTAANEDPDGDGVKFVFNLRFPGQYFDKETGLHYNYFRDYNPATGRYVQSDPIGLEGGINTYSYAYQNALSYIDPDGQLAFLAPIAIGLWTGLEVGLSAYDAYSTYKTLVDSCKGNEEKIAAASLFAIGIVAPGGGYQAAGQRIARSSILNTTEKQLQAKFKHAGDFGVSGSYNKVNANKLSSAINQHINSETVQTISGTYRRQPVIHYVDPGTGLNVISSPSGQFISGWKLNPEQLRNVLKHGGL